MAKDDMGSVEHEPREQSISKFNGESSATSSHPVPALELPLGDLDQATQPL